jgi:hypothetical protein
MPSGAPAIALIDAMSAAVRVRFLQVPPLNRYPIPQFILGACEIALKKAFSVSVAEVMPEVFTFWNVREFILVEGLYIPAGLPVVPSKS